MRKTLGLASALLSAAFASVGVVAPARSFTRGIDGSGRPTGTRFRFNSGSIARGNRHGGPHEHKREIARHLRQQLRASATA